MYPVVVCRDSEITTTHHRTEYQYAGVDRREDCYKLMVGEKLLLVSKLLDEDYPYVEPFQTDDFASGTWTEEDYENLQQQYE